MVRYRVKPPEMEFHKVAYRGKRMIVERIEMGEYGLDTIQAEIAQVLVPDNVVVVIYVSEPAVYGFAVYQPRK